MRRVNQDQDGQAAGQRGSAGHDHMLEEFRLLLDALAYRAEDFLHGLACEGDGESQAPGTCGWCPLCALIAAMRGERSELTSKFAEQLAGIVMLLRQLIAEHGGTSDFPAPEPPPGAPQAPDDTPAESKVQKIAVHRVDGRVLKSQDC